ncbi:hypothetical protein PG996_007710 [Apiospora saccharicola]|uniref:Uncharacterized protein n=1 Tax=Apiospora saccharicola TaxID=335842 RepID=A0ABR1VFC7_9PEZI
MTDTPFRPLGHSFTLQWNKESAVIDANHYATNDHTRKQRSQNFSRVMVYVSGERLLGSPGPVPDATSIVTTCSIRFNIARPAEFHKVNTFGIKFLFPKDSALDGPERHGGESETKIGVEFLFQAPNYDTVYEGPFDKAVLPVGTKAATGDRYYIKLRVRALNGAKPEVVGFPSDQASKMAKFFVPLLEQQDSFVIAIEDRT